MANSKKQSTIRLHHGLGWKKDEHDWQDWTWNTVKRTLIRQRVMRPAIIDDLRHYFPPVRDQGSRNSSTVFACLAVIEYFERRTLGAFCERSKAFLYAMTSTLIDANTSSHGFGIRDTLKTLVRFGAPPEIYWPYSSENCELIPNNHLLFSFVREFQGLRYARLDWPDGSGKGALKKTRKCLQVGIPVVFGFDIQHFESPTTLFPVGEPLNATGWQSVVACGYDDRMECLLIRNSWGTKWGIDGYNWLPYQYLIRNQAADFWIMFKDEWLEQIAQPRKPSSAT